MASSSWLCDWQDEHGLCWEMETQILCGQQERGIRSGGPAEEWKEKVEQMPSFKFTRSLLGDVTVCLPLPCVSLPLFGFPVIII